MMILLPEVEVVLYKYTRFVAGDNSGKKSMA